MTQSSRPKRGGAVKTYFEESDESSIDSVIDTSPRAKKITVDKRNWNGFVEVESEPSFFNVMLRDFGVSGVKVQEVISLDEESLNCLPRPVYGLIFLFRWREDEELKEEPECPNGVWFANQTIDNACATIAMLNIVNNIQGIELGENLQAFKDFTKDFTPPLRGDAIANFQFVKEIHNSFARQVDILSEDVQMKEKARSKRLGKEIELDEEDEAPCFHFIAFVPVEGKVWKLDGLERQPQNLGDIETTDWIFHVKPELQDRMAKYEDGQTEFSILGLVKAPLDGIVSQLAQNVKNICALREKINSVKPGWTNDPDASGHFNLGEHGVIIGQSQAYSLTQGQLDKTEVSPDVQALILRDIGVVYSGPRACDIQEPADNGLNDLLACMQELANQQVDLRTSISEELEACNQDRERAAKRRQDWTPPVELLVKFLSRKGSFPALLERCKAWSPHAG